MLLPLLLSPSTAAAATDSSDSTHSSLCLYRQWVLEAMLDAYPVATRRAIRRARGVASASASALAPALASSGFALAGEVKVDVDVEQVGGGLPASLLELRLLADLRSREGRLLWLAVHVASCADWSVRLGMEHDGLRCDLGCT